MNSKKVMLWLTVLSSIDCFGEQAPAFTRQYEIGKIYSYDYFTTVLLNEPQKIPLSPPKDVGFNINLQVDLQPVWVNPSNTNEQIMELKVSSPNLAVKSRQGSAPGFTSKPSRIDKLNQFPVFFIRENGLVKKIFYTIEEELSFLNIKKGIASLFQYHSKEISEGFEIDASGNCKTSYIINENNKNLMQKIKSQCLPIYPVNTFNHTKMVMGAKISSQFVSKLELNPSDGSLLKSDTEETHTMRPEIRQKSGVEVIGKQSLKLKEKVASRTSQYYGKTAKEVIENISKKLKSSLIAEGLSTKLEPKECIACKSLKELLGSLKKSLTASTLGSQSSAIAFLRLLKKMRDSGYESIKQVLVDKKNNKILFQLIDIVAATQTIPAHKAALSVVKFEGKNVELSERYLLGLSLNTHPLEFVIEDLLSVAKRGMKNENLAETLVLSIGSMIKTFAANEANIKQKIISTVETYFLNQLNGCDNEKCFLMYIRSLKNLQSKTTLPILLFYAQGKWKKLAIYAMRAIQTFPHDSIDSKTNEQLEKILFQLDAPHDSSVRAMASDVLLRGIPEERILRDIFFMISRSNSSEFNTLLLAHINDLTDKNEEIKAITNNIVRVHDFSNYHIFGQGGLSSAFSRPLFQDNSINASFSNMLEISGGILKRSNVDVYVELEDSRMRLLSFGMFAGGLSSFSGGSGAEDDDEDANAGMEISLLDSQLRPFTFFSGQGELMGHVMSGTASEKTTALQGSLLLHDHSQVVALQNGFNVDLLLTGAASYDFSGQIQISLWYRNAHSLVEVGAAVVLRGEARVDNSFVQTNVEFNVGSQSQLNLISDIDFSDEVVMCMQMEQPSFELVDNVRKLERIPGSNYILRKYKRKSAAIPGKTYVINRKNTELCTKMHSDK